MSSRYHQGRKDRERVPDRDLEKDREHFSKSELFKTKFCRNYEMGHKCPFEKECRYAHSMDELRTINENRDYHHRHGRYEDDEDDDDQHYHRRHYDDDYEEEEVERPYYSRRDTRDTRETRDNRDNHHRDTYHRDRDSERRGNNQNQHQGRERHRPSHYHSSDRERDRPGHRETEKEYHTKEYKTKEYARAERDDDFEREKFSSSKNSSDEEPHPPPYRSSTNVKPSRETEVAPVVNQPYSSFKNGDKPKQEFEAFEASKNKEIEPKSKPIFEPPQALPKAVVSPIAPQVPPQMVANKTVQQIVMQSGPTPITLPNGQQIVLPQSVQPGQQIVIQRPGQSPIVVQAQAQAPPPPPQQFQQVYVQPNGQQVIVQQAPQPQPQYVIQQQHAPQNNYILQPNGMGQFVVQQQPPQTIQQVVQLPNGQQLIINSQPSPPHAQPTQPQLVMQPQQVIVQQQSPQSTGPYQSQAVGSAPYSSLSAQSQQQFLQNQYAGARVITNQPQQFAPTSIPLRPVYIPGPKKAAPSTVRAAPQNNLSPDAPAFVLPSNITNNNNAVPDEKISEDTFKFTTDNFIHTLHGSPTTGMDEESDRPLTDLLNDIAHLPNHLLDE